MTKSSLTLVYHIIRVTINFAVIIDIHVMLFAGFGFLMTFLTNYGYSAISFTIIITATVTEFAILVIGWSRLEAGQYIININFIHVLEGGLAAASVLISFGVVIGKLNPFQLLVMGIIETILFTINMHIGYVMFGAVDVGKIIFFSFFFIINILEVVQCLFTHSAHISE